MVALEEMTEAGKRVGYLAKAVDADLYLAKVRKAVAEEAQCSAFARYVRLAQQTQAQIDGVRQGLEPWRSPAKPTDASSEQLRGFHAAYDGIPRADVTSTRHNGTIAWPSVPSLAEFVDQTGSGQEELMLAFTELFSVPTGRHVFFAIALVSSGAPESQWARGAAALDSLDAQVFAHDFLRKVGVAPGGLARLSDEGLSSGEKQLPLLLRNRGLATHADGGFLLHPAYHASLVERLAVRGVPLRASRAANV